jgi:phage-related protein
MAVFTHVPDKGLGQEETPRVREAPFGDGYSQRVGDGINSVDEVFNLNFTVRTKAEITAIASFLRGEAGVTSFQWTPPDGVQRRFICKKWMPSYNHDGDCSLSATFIRVFEP